MHFKKYNSWSIFIFVVIYIFKIWSPIFQAPCITIKLQLKTILCLVLEKRVTNFDSKFQPDLFYAWGWITTLSFALISKCLSGTTIPQLGNGHRHSQGLIIVASAIVRRVLIFRIVYQIKNIPHITYLHSLLNHFHCSHHFF